MLLLKHLSSLSGLIISIICVNTAVKRSILLSWKHRSRDWGRLNLLLLLWCELLLLIRQMCLLLWRTPLRNSWGRLWSSWLRLRPQGMLLFCCLLLLWWSSVLLHLSRLWSCCLLLRWTRSSSLLLTSHLLRLCCLSLGLLSIDLLNLYSDLLNLEAGLRFAKNTVKLWS